MIGCASAAHPYFDRAGFHGGEESYLIRYHKPGTALLLPGNWRVTNFRTVKDGLPTDMKTLDAYKSTLTWTYGNGATSRVTTTTYDLVLSHPSEAMIWVRILPVPGEMRNKAVKVIAEGWANHISGSLYTGYLDSGPDEVRIATEIIQSEQVLIANRPARLVTFDAANVDQLELNRNAPRTRVMIAVVKGAWRKTLEASSGHVTVPGVLFVAYSHAAKDFDSLLPQFKAFLEQISVLGTGKSTTGAK